MNISPNDQPPVPSSRIGRQSFAIINNTEEVAIRGGNFVSSTGPVTIFTGSSDTTYLHAISDDSPTVFQGDSSHPTGAFHVESDTGYQKADYDIYYHQLLGKGRGTPLWQPGPSMSLPNEYRRSGIGIGDVGILYRGGDFDFLFNILLPADHKINEGRVPVGFIPLDRSKLERNGVNRYVPYGPRSCLASSSVRRTSNVNSSDFAFETTDREGAILIMPDGALSEDLRNHNVVEKYIAANAKSWYEYVEGDDYGRRIENGDIRVVVGFDKVSSWGIATFASNVEELVRFEFKGVNDRPASHMYMWDCVGSGNGRVGPQEEEMRDLILEPHAPPLRNQQLAVHEVRSNDVKTLDSSGPTIANDASHPGISKSKLETNAVTFHHSHLGHTISHPSKFLNKCLLENFPNAEMVITKDFDWMSVISEDVAIPDVEELCVRVLASHLIYEDDGVITLLRMAPDLTSTSNFIPNSVSESVEWDDWLVDLENSGTVPHQHAAVLAPREASGLNTWAQEN